MKAEFLNKIKNNAVKVGVVGLGYVGLPLAVEKAKAGFTTVGFDVQKHKVDMVNEGKNYIGDVVNTDLEELVNQGLLSATDDFSFIKDMDFIAICVPTPLDTYQQPDISYVKNSAIEIGKHLKKGAAVVLESTTYPGTTEELVKPILEQESGLICGTDFYLGFSPERVDPGNNQFKTKNTPKVVGAVGEDAAEVISEMYATVLEGQVYPVSSPSVAEMEKLLENTYRNVNIALINEMAMLCNKMNIDVWEVIEAAKTKPYGFTAFYPGPGPGGHCIPLDPYYLAWKAREFGFHTSMIEASAMINDKMPEYCYQRSVSILNEKGIPLKGSRVLLLGIAYKKDVADFRESPALKLWKLLTAGGAELRLFDTLVGELMIEHEKVTSLKEINQDILEGFDLVIITCDHSHVDYAMVEQHAKLVFDTRGVLRHQKSDKIFLL